MENFIFCAVSKDQLKHAFVVPWEGSRYNISISLILPILCISENCIKIKVNLNFIFTLLYGASEGFMKAFKTFMKPFEHHREVWK